MNPIDDRVNSRRFEHRRSVTEDAVRWPGGAALALSFVLNIEEGAELSLADGDGVNEAVHEITQRVDGASDFCMGTHFEFGARVGHARVLQRFADRGLALTLNACGRALQRTPWVADVAQRQGFELCGHGWQWLSPVHLDETAERDAIARTAQVIAQLGGRTPAGWHCKGSRSVATRRLLREHGGFVYDSDDYGDETPWLIDFDDGRPPHVVVPYGFDCNDMRFFDHGGFVRGADFAGYVIDSIDALRREPPARPRMLTIGLHSRIIGRPGRIGGLDAVLDHVQRLRGEVAVMTREAIARHWLDALHP